MEEIKISVVIPVYNVKNYLRECVNSVLCQTIKAYEIILVDDGSNDGSELICDEYINNESIKVIHKENGGVSSARNEGINVAKGDYICFVDADDYIEKGTIDNYLRIIDKYGRVDCIVDRMKDFYDGTTEFFKINDFYINNDAAAKKTGKEVFALARAKYKRFDVGLRGIFNLSLIKEKSIFFNEQYKSSEDADWMIKFLMYADRGMLGSEKANYCYRARRKNSLQNTYNLRRVDDFLLVYNSWNNILKDYKEKNTSFYREFAHELGNRYIRLFSKTLKKVNDNDYLCAKEHILNNSYLLKYCYPENKKSFIIYVLSRLLGSKNAVKLYIRRNENK